MMFPNFFSEYSFYELDNDGNGQAENDHCRNREIKSKVFPFDPYITR